MQGKKKQQNKTQTTKKNIIRGYEIFEELGKGSFAHVYKAVKDGNNVAIKMIEKCEIKKKNLEKYVRNEIKVMQELNCDHTLKLYENFEDAKYIYLVLEYCNEGTLMQYIVKNKPNEEQSMMLFVQILKGFLEIHKKNYIHRDLKPENIFIHNRVLKIADFGLSKPCSMGTTYCGTSYYMSPEILMKAPYDYKADLWSLGVILYFMLFRKYPFVSRQNRIKEILQATSPIFDLRKHLKDIIMSQKITDDVCELFKNIFTFEAYQRISFSVLYNQKFLQKYIKKEEMQQSQQLYQTMENSSHMKNYSKEDDENDKEYQLLQQKTIKLDAKSIQSLIRERDDDLSDIDDQIKENPQNDQIGNKINQDKNQTKIKTEFSDIDELSIVEEGGIGQQNLCFIYQKQMSPFKFIEKQDKPGPRSFCDQMSQYFNDEKQDNQIDNDQNNQQIEQIKKKQVQQNQKIQVEDEKKVNDQNLQIKQTKSEIDIDEQEEINSQDLKESLIQHLLGNSDEHQLYLEQMQYFQYEMQKYQFLGDTIEIVSSQMQLTQSTRIIVNYIISKLLLFFAINLKDSLVEKKNPQKLKNFDNFCDSKEGQYFIQRIELDIQRWNTKYLMFYYGIDKDKDISSDQLKKIITEEIVEKNFESDLKLPVRTILDVIFKQGYTLGKRAVKQQDSINFLRPTLCILLVMLINNIFDKVKAKDHFSYYFLDRPEETDLDLWKLFSWIKQCNRDKLLLQIHKIIEKAFGQKKLEIFLKI